MQPEKRQPEKSPKEESPKEERPKGERLKGERQQGEKQQVENQSLIQQVAVGIQGKYIMSIFPYATSLSTGNYHMTKYLSTTVSMTTLGFSPVRNLSARTLPSGSSSSSRGIRHTKGKSHR